jgi:MFS family permease
VSGYTDLLKTPGVARIISAQLTARLPSGMISLAFLIHIERIFDSYGAAGLVLAATSVGQAIAGPLTSRWMGRLGMRPVLITTLVVCSTGLGLIAFVMMPLWQFMIVGFIVGISTPPIQPAVRTIYPKMVTGKQLTPLFALDASAQEIIWVMGPFATVVLATQVSPVAAIATAGVFLVGGGIWFIASPEVGKVRIPVSKRRIGVVLKNRAVLLATVCGFLLIGSAASIEVGVVAVFGEGGAEAGILFGIWAIASLVGGLSMGHLPIGPWALARRFSIVLVGMAAAPFSLEFWWLAIALVIAGIGIAPVLAVMFAIVSASVKFSDTPEAYGWLGTGQLMGAALGSAIAGFLIDALGSVGGFYVALSFAVVGVLFAAVFHRWHPDLRGRDASPLADTEPVQVVS